MKSVSIYDSTILDDGRSLPPNTSHIHHNTFSFPFTFKQERATEVVKSLPGAVWDTYASHGWGPQHDGEFMQFDYGGANSWLFPSGIYTIEGKRRT